MLSQENQVAESQETYMRCIELDPLDGRAFLGLSRLQACARAQMRMPQRLAAAALGLVQSVAEAKALEARARPAAAEL